MHPSPFPGPVQLLLQVSLPQALPSSQTSSPLPPSSRIPLTQVAPGFSSLQEVEQPAPSTVLPSSQDSGGLCTTPSPQTILKGGPWATVLKAQSFLQRS